MKQNMTYYQTRALWVVATAIILMTAGCNLECGRKDAAQRRWQRTMDQARLDAAQKSIDQGRWLYAERVLQGCTQDQTGQSDVTEQARQMLAAVQTANRQFAKARQESADPEDQVY